MKNSHPTLLCGVGFALACVWPGLHFLAENAAQFDWIGRSAVLVVVSLCVILWLIGAGIAVVPRLFWRRWSIARAFAVGTVGVFLLFSHHAIHSSLVQGLSVNQLLARAIYLALLVASLVAVQRLSAYQPTRILIVMAAALMVTFSIRGLQPIATLLAPARVGAPVIERAPPRTLSNNNVYYVILDGYGGNAALKKYVGYDNNHFLQQMQGLGYTHLEGRTNYVTTYLSLMALLEMDYVVRENSPRHRNRLDFFPSRLQRGRMPTAIKELFAAGYKVVHAGNAWAPCAPRPEIVCLTHERASGLYKEVAIAFLANTKAPAAIDWLFGRSDALDALSTLSAAINRLTQDGQPFFALVHNIAPHPPYLSSDCTTRSRSTSREAYSNSIACVNQAVYALASRIRASDPTAIVVFQADHGTDFEVDWLAPLTRWSDAAIDERSSILNLIHVPQRCRQWLRPGLSQINTMRLVIACLEDRPPSYLSERTYISTYERNPDFGLAVDVTDRLARRQATTP